MSNLQDPRFLELAGRVAIGIATDEEKLEFKAMKKEVKAELKQNLTPEMIIARLEKRIVGIQETIAFVRENGKLPEKQVTLNEDGTPKKRGRPAKVA